MALSSAARVSRPKISFASCVRRQSANAGASLRGPFRLLTRPCRPAISLKTSRRASSGKSPSSMQAVLIVIHLLIAIALIFVIMLQRSEGGALGLGGGASGLGGLFSPRAAANPLARTTVVLGVLFFATSLALTLLTLGARQNTAPLLLPGQPAGPAAPAAPGAPPTLPSLPALPAPGTAPPAGGLPAPAPVPVAPTAPVPPPPVGVPPAK